MSNYLDMDDYNHENATQEILGVFTVLRALNVHYDFPILAVSIVLKVPEAVEWIDVKLCNKHIS